MVRNNRRTHSVSGPLTMKDVASCCCDLVKFHQFQQALMALRRNPQRRCRKDEALMELGSVDATKNEESSSDEYQAVIVRSIQQRKFLAHRRPESSVSQPFRLFDLPRELRDKIYSCLVVRRGKRTPVVEARAILRAQRKRLTARRTREKLNEKRALTGKPPIVPRETIAEPVVHLEVLPTSKQLYYEASDCMYQTNWFAISLDNYDFSDFRAALCIPQGWDLTRITRLQLELQLKDSQRMNSHVDWATFFSNFSSLRFLRIIPTFHQRYYYWAQAELRTWDGAHFVFRAFFRELLASVPGSIHLALGPSADPEDDMQLEGKTAVSGLLLHRMHAELYTRRGIDSA